MALFPNILNEQCNDIGAWTNGDYDTGVSEVSPAGQFRFDTNTGAAGNAYASRYRTLVSPPNQFTIEARVCCDLVGKLSSDGTDSDGFSISYQTGTWRLTAAFCADGLFIYKTGGGVTEVGTNIVKTGASKDWQTWRFQVDKSSGEGAATAEVFLDDVSQGTVDCDYEASSTDGRLIITQLGFTKNDTVSHMDYIKVASGLGALDTGDGSGFLMFF
jgi:hypothetical protein